MPKALPPAPGDRAAPRVSIVIPMRNEAAYVERCLASVCAQTYPHDRLEVLVVDGESTDDSAARVARFAADGPVPIRLLRNPKRIASAGLNIGVAASTGDYVVILGAHSEAAPDYVEAAIAAALRTGADCVGGPIDSVAPGSVGRAIAAAMSTPFGVGGALFRYSREEAWVDTVAYGLYPRAVFDRVGLFDETLARNIDDEFNYRLHSRGGRILLTPRIRSTYYTRSGFRQLLSQYYAYGFWKVPVLLRYPSCIRFRHLAPPAFVAAVALGAALAPVHRAFTAALLALLALYSGAAALLAVREAVRRRAWYPLLMPLVFACLHVGYGTGMFAGAAGALARLLRQGAR